MNLTCSRDVVWFCDGVSTYTVGQESTGNSLASKNSYEPCSVLSIDC